MSARILIVGKTFGKVTVLASVEPSILPCGQVELRCLCRCECGKEFITKERYLRVGWTKSCGCWKNEKIGNLNRTHSKSKTRTHRIWMGMFQRTTNPNNPKYPRYGGRGIKVCERWKSFENFFEDMGEAPPNLTIERIDNNGNYSKENCKWGTPKQQARNTRRNRIYTVNGVTGCTAELCEHFGVPYARAYYRLLRGWSPDLAFSTRIDI